VNLTSSRHVFPLVLSFQQSRFDSPLKKHNNNNANPPPNNTRTTHHIPF
jgi:hypothetical protein